MDVYRTKFVKQYDCIAALAGAGASCSVLAAPLKALYSREASGKKVFGKGYGAL